MCGVVGIVGALAGTPAARSWLDEALVHLRLRGPDAGGVCSDPGALLGHRRLALRDLSPAGSQPMVSASGDSVLVYNGELYHTDNLRRLPTLARRALRGHSDTELLLEHLEASFHEDLAATLAPLVGMFAFGHWHRPTRTLTLSRDPVGLKPLYFVHRSDGSLAFCSEPRPLYRLPGVDLTLDPTALRLYLALGALPSPWSMAKGVRQLRPGESLVWRDGAVHVRATTRLPLPSASDAPPSAQALEDLKRLLLQVVADQMVSDVPVGVLLSGGVDSSVVAAAAARHTSRLKTFSVVHANPAYDERAYARAVAEHLGTEHVELELPAAGMTTDDLDVLLHHTADPFADSSALPTYRLSRLVRQHVTVTLSGDGGDEIFGGYPRYLIQDRVRGLGRLPGWFRRAVDRTSRSVALPGTRVRQVARALHLSLRTPAQQALGTTTYSFPEEHDLWLRPDFCGTDVYETLLADRGWRLEHAPGAWELHALEQNIVLPDVMLVKVDRMSMAASLEVRPPLLDDRVVRFASALPFSEKMRRGEGKAILKEVARAWVPSWVVDRPKMGFAIPLTEFGGPVLAEQGRWAFRSAESPLRQIFFPAALADLDAEQGRAEQTTNPEISPFRAAHRRWVLVLLARALHDLRLGLPA